MNFTVRELALLMVALDNTSAQMMSEGVATDNAKIRQQAKELDGLWDRVMLAREELTQGRVSSR